MVDFEQARKIAFDEISKYETVQIQSEYFKNKLNFNRYVEAWSIKTEIFAEANVKNIEFYICFKHDFPLSIPVIYLSQKDYDEFKYIPHVDTNKLICTFDTEISKSVVSKPSEIVRECLKRAKSIVESGINKTNLKDFDEEFLAYWECNYFRSDQVRHDVLCLIDPANDDINPFTITLDSKLFRYNYVIHNNDDIANTFKRYLKEHHIKFVEEKAFFFQLLPTISFHPPYNLSNGDINEIIKEVDVNLHEQFKAFINSKIESKLVLMKLAKFEKEILVGWVNLGLTKLTSGFRQKNISAFQRMSKINSENKIVRLIPDIFTQNRQNNRSSGEIEPKFKFLVAGIGSIGSNLIHFLNSMNTPEFRLVDDDDLKAENIARHLLGFNSIGQPKVDVVKEFLKQLNPIQEIKTLEKSIIDVILNDVAFINDVDYIFLATGKDNVDEFVCQCLENNTITKPIFVLWIEPHLAGGHLLYFPPNCDITYENFFNDGFYKYNIISDEFYKSPENSLALKEAGCQTTYIPYSSQNVLLFLSSVFPKINSIIKGENSTSQCWTWIGNLEYLSKHNIQISDFAKGKSSGTIVQNKWN